MKREDKGRMDELKVEVGVKESFKKKLVRLKWARYVKRIGDEIFSKRADTKSGGENQARKIENVM